MEQILKLEKTDDITAIRSRIDFAFPPPPVSSVPAESRLEKRRLLLLVPYKNKALQSLVNMKLLARVVKTKAVEMAIVSGHPAVRDYAKEAGVKVFSSLSSAKRAGWVTPKAPVTSPDKTSPPVAPVDEKTETDVRETNTKKDKDRRVTKKKYIVVQGSGRIGILQQLGALLLLAILALALVVGVIILLPEATVTLTPVAQPVETKLVVKADPDVESVDFQSLTFPARPVQVELALSDEIETVETELAPTGTAEGRVTFINRTEDEQTIPISTTLSTSVGEQIKFIIVETATIPAGIGRAKALIPEGLAGGSADIGSALMAIFL